MKKVCLLILVLGFSISFVFSQEQKNQEVSESYSYLQAYGLSMEEYAKTITNLMAIELKLSAEQITRIDAINLRFIKAGQVLLEAQEEASSFIDKALRILEKDRDTCVSLVLTKKQLKKFWKYKKNK